MTRRKVEPSRAAQRRGLGQSGCLDLCLDPRLSLSRHLMTACPRSCAVPGTANGYDRHNKGGEMTRDLAILTRPEHPWLTTNQVFNTLDRSLQKAMS